MHFSTARACLARFALTPVALALLASPAALAQAPAEAPAAATPPLPLRGSPALREDLPPELRPQLPLFVEGNRLSGRTELETVVEGDAVLRRGDTVIKADKLEYFQPQDKARATGNVLVNRGGNRYRGDLLELEVEAFQGFFTAPHYRFLRNDAYGSASRIDFLDNERSVIHQGSYTTCQPGDQPGWQAPWMVTAERLELDTAANEGRATGARLRFFGVPLLPVPSFSFPLSEARKSGLLPPTAGVDSKSGIEFTQPYYWNIAPNRDATFSPTLMARRGLDLAGEFRYLEPGYRGQVQANWLPADRLVGRDRWAFSGQHGGIAVAPGIGALGVSLNVNRVSDNDYWRDFSRGTGSLTQRLLASDGIVSWGTESLSLTARALTWQTLQDLSSPIIPPYDRLPQLAARYTPALLPAGLTLVADADFTRFQSDRVLNNQPNARRAFTHLQLSRPWQAPGWFVVPRLQLHATQYEFDAPLADGRRSASRTVPTASVDAGIVLERDLRLWGRDLVQTLEPRAFYVYTPYREQRLLPNYDSAANDFNFATIWTENAFGGHDRIADNNLLTLGATSRLLDSATGAELARAGIAQRLRFADQRVTLPGGTPATQHLSDVLVGGAINWSPAWATEATVQYNPESGRSIRTILGARYSPSPYRTVSTAYRLQRGQSEQLELGWQWPLNDLWGDRGRDLGPGRGQGGGRWYSVGRLNASLKDKRLVDTVLGLEYDGCCWIGRIVFERLQSGTTSSSKRILFQLEFIGFTRLGSNTLRALRDNVPRYQYLREQVAPPSRFTQYD